MVKTLRQIIGEQPPGNWVAISLTQKCVVGLAPTAKEARLRANAHGKVEVILLRVPDSHAVALKLPSEAEGAA
jgi:hypothetical protein